MVGREGRLLTWDDILFGAEEVADAGLLYVRVFRLEFVREAKGHDGQTSIIIRRRLAILGRGDFSLPVLVLALGSVDIADTAVPPRRLEGFGEKTCVRERVLHDGSIARET